jgi:hypothetical protein
LSSLAVSHRDKPEPFGAAGVAVRNDPGRVHHTIGLKELAEGVIGNSQREIAYKDIHVEFLGERGETMATSSLQLRPQPYRGETVARHVTRIRGEVL